MPLVSVIIPVYNGEKTIQKTIASVLAQTLSDWELIIINDGSQDSTLEIINQIQDQRLKIFTYPNAGQAESRNRGLKQASGKYISFLDADDLWTPDKLEAQLKALQANPHAAVAYSWIDYIDESGQFYRRGNYITLNGNVYAHLLLTDFLENGSNLLIVRQALKEIGGFNPFLTPAEDWDLCLRLAAHYEFVAVPSPQILYRVSANSASTNVWKMETACLQVIELAFNQAPESLQHLKRHSIANLYKFLTFKVLEGTPERQKGLAALRFLGQATRHSPSLLYARVSLKVLLKSWVMILLHPQQTQAFLSKFNPLLDTTTILGYLQTDPQL